MVACKPALESRYITKVIHDCKRDSEVLNDSVILLYLYCLSLFLSLYLCI